MTDANGVVTASAWTGWTQVPGTYTLTAKWAGDTGYSASTSPGATFTIEKKPATITIVPSSLSQTYTGAPLPVTITIEPTGTTLGTDVTITYEGVDGTTYGPLTVAPTEVGRYSVLAVLDNLYYGAPDATGTLVIIPAVTPTTLTLGSLSATYDGNPHAVSVTTDPAGQDGNVTFLYTGIDPTVYAESATAPTDAGSYHVVATLNTATHTGSAEADLVISPATATLELVAADLTQTVGSTTAVGFTVVPSTLAPDVMVTYTGVDPTIYGPSTTPPTVVGSYDVAASLTNANYAAPVATGTLVISPPAVIATTLTLGNLSATFDGTRMRCPSRPSRTARQQTSRSSTPALTLRTDLRRTRQWMRAATRSSPRWTRRPTPVRRPACW